MTTIGAARPAAPARSVQGLPAGVVSRSLAAAIDVLLAATVAGSGYLLLSGVMFLWRPDSFSFPAISRFVGLVGVAAVLVVYAAGAWWLTGRTVGNDLLGLRVRTRGGDRLGLVRATLRALSYIAFPLGLLFCVVGERRSSVQDLVVRTTVVYDWTRAGGRPPR